MAVLLDRNLPDDPRIVEAGPIAAWLLVCLLCLADRTDSDGFVPAANVRRELVSQGQTDPEQVIERMVRVGIFESTERNGVVGFQLHSDYMQWQLTAAQKAERRQKKADAGRRGGLQSGEARRKQARRKPEAETKHVLHQDRRNPDSEAERSKVEAEAKQNEANTTFTSTSTSTSTKGTTPVAAATVPHIAVTSVDQSGNGNRRRPRPGDLQELWNGIVTPPIPKVMQLTPGRQRACQVRLNDFSNLEDWRTVIAYLNGQGWCRASGTGDHPDWTATFDWLLKPGVFQKYLEKAQTPLVNRGSGPDKDGLVGRDPSRGRTGYQPGNTRTSPGSRRKQRNGRAGNSTGKRPNGNRLPRQNKREVLTCIRNCVGRVGEQANGGRDGEHDEAGQWVAGLASLARVEIQRRRCRRPSGRRPR